MSLEDVLWDMHEKWLREKKMANDNVNPVFKPMLDAISSPFCECGWYANHLGTCQGKPKGYCTSNAKEQTLGHTICLKPLPCPDHQA